MPKVPAVVIPDPPAGPIDPHLVVGYDPVLGTGTETARYTLRVFLREEIEFVGERDWVMVVDGGDWAGGTGLPANTLEDVAAGDAATNALVRRLWERGVAVISMGYTVQDAGIPGEGAFDPAAFKRESTIPESLLTLDVAQQGLRCAEKDVAHAVQLIRWNGLNLGLDQQDSSGGLIGLGSGAASAAWTALGLDRRDRAVNQADRDGQNTRIGWFVAVRPQFSWNAYTDAVALAHLTDGAGGTAATVGDAKAVADGADNQNIRDASALWYGFNFANIRVRNAELPVYLVGYGTGTYGGALDYASFDGAVSDPTAVEMVDAMQVALLAAEAEFGGTTQSTVSRFTTNPAQTPEELAEEQYQWALGVLELEELQQSAAAFYAPDFQESYTPPGVFPTPWEFMTVFLPDPAVHPRPPGGYSAVMGTGFGGFASTPPSKKIQDLPSDIIRTLWLALESGTAVISFGLPGSDTADFAPGGSKYNLGQGPNGDGTFVLGKPIKGQGTFDIPGNDVEGFDHFDDVGSSLDGGCTYPHEDFPIMAKSAVLAVQYVRSRAKAWGIDSRLLALQARSAGAVATAAAVYGPDRADPDMQDHRAESSRVPLAIHFAQSMWLPGFVNGTSASSFFPNAFDPEAVATSLAQAPADYVVEGSALRYGFRGYESEGPAISGDALRARNGGELALFLINTDQSLGLNGSTPTEALQFTGSDVTNDRVPTLTSEVPAATTHPAIMGPLLAARLREVDPGGFQDANSRLMMRQGTYDELAGHVQEGGAPIQDLVTNIRENEEDADGTISPVIATWLQEQFVRLRTELGIDDTPPAPQVEHERATLRRRIAEYLKGKTAAGDRVFPSRVRRLDPSEIPALYVHTRDEQWTLVDEAPRRYRVDCELRLIATVRGNDSWEDVLDPFCLQIEEVVEADETFGGLAERTVMSSTSLGAEAEGRSIEATRALEYSLRYLVEAPRNKPVYDEFQRAQGAVLAPDGSTIDFQANPEQL